MPRAIYQLTDADREIYHRARLDGGDARYFTDYYLNGWLFDNNIADPWQLEAHHTYQSELTLIGGFGCGKTVAFGISYLIRAATIPYYKFLNVSSVAWQSRQMFEAIMLTIENTRLREWFVDMGGKVIERPYPKLTLSNSYIGKSTMEFMSADKQGVKILSWEGDAAHIDEAGLIDDLEETVRNLGTRLRGTLRHKDLFDSNLTITRAREARLSMTSNAWENPYMWWRVDMAKELPVDYWGRILTTYSNKNLTEKQIRNFENKITTEEDKDQWLRGVRPKGIGDQFSADTIEKCTDRSLNAVMEMALKEKVDGFYMATAEKAGINVWEMPYEEERIYMVIGDPGQANPPGRNAPCIGVFDVTDFPGKPAVLRAFWWGLGRGSYQPFVQTMYRYAEKYKSLDLAFDATGSQKMMDELVFERDGLNVHGLNMTGLKHAFNTSLKLFMEKGMIAYPEIPGIRAQLGNYRFPDKKIAQDIVAMLQMAAGYLRRFYYVSQDEDEDADWEDDHADSRYSRNVGSRHARTGASRSSR
jgi:hypothetical protein